MRRSLVVMGLLSATVLTSVAFPSHSEDLTPTSSQNEQSVIRIIEGNAAENDDAVPGRLLRIAQAERNDRGGSLLPPWDHDGRRFAPHHKDWEEARWEHGGLQGGPHGPRDPMLGLAGRLSALETYVGITSAQLDAWRAYTSALIDFLEPPEQRRTPDRQAPPMPPNAEDMSQPPKDIQPAPLFAERLADGAIARAEKAKALKQAIDALRSTLSAEQLDRLAKAEPAFGPHHPVPGPAGQDTDHRGPAGEILPLPPEED